jgi:hypothetical protein
MDAIFLVLLFCLGYIARGILERLSKSAILKEAEFLWFNPSAFQWERINKNSKVTPRSRVLMGIPVEPSSLDLEQIHEFQSNNKGI